jgi:ATP-binding cassette subfamily F protein uup
VLGLDGRGHAALFADYIQWEEWRDQMRASARDAPAGNGTKAAQLAPVPQAPKKKLSYLEQREYDGLEVRIEAADARLQAARVRIEHPTVATDAAALTEALAELEFARIEHDAIYERWAELTEDRRLTFGGPLYLGQK